MNLEISSIVSGKSKDELAEQKKKPMAKWKKATGLLIPGLLIARWLYTRYRRNKSGDEVVDEYDF